MMPDRVVVWLDRKAARILALGLEAPERTVTAPLRGRHKLSKLRREHPDDQKPYFRELSDSLRGTAEILLVGPSATKHDFFKYVHEHDRDLEARVIGVETVDHPARRQLVAYGKRYFAKSHPT